MVGYPVQGHLNGASSFTSLTDAPTTYVGQSGKYPRVTVTEDGLEFVSGVATTVAFTDLTDAPSSYSGQAGLVPKVNVGESGLEFSTLPTTILDLTDTPSAYGFASQVLQMNASADGLEFATTSGTWGSITGDIGDQLDLAAVFASKSLTTVNYYVYEDAVGTGDGSSYENGFPSLQAAITAAPDFCNLVINVRKGSTNYLGDNALIYKHGISQIAIQGEYSWGASCDANGVAGKIVDSDFATTGMATGDIVVCLHYTGGVNASSIDEYFYATITGIGSGYVQTSEATKIPTTGWTYIINSTVFDGNNSSSRILAAGTTPFVNVTGIGFVNQDDAVPFYISQGIGQVTRCIFYNTRGISADYGSYIGASNCGVIGTAAGDYSLVSSSNNSYVRITSSAISGANTYGIYTTYGSRINGRYLNIDGTTYGVYSGNADCQAALNSGYIESTVTTGLYGYNITTISCTNNATTPVTNVTSGGSVDQWDGYDLPSVTYAVGEQVLRLNSGKTALEFATVTGGSTTFLALTDTPVAYDYPTKYVRINATNDGLEFATITEGVTTFIELTDAPAAYGYPTQYVRMNTAGDALEFATALTTFIGLTDVPAAYDYPTKYLRINSTNDGLEFSTITTVATDTIWEAAGDLVVGTGSDTAARLAMGFASQQLRVNESGTGLEFATITVGSGSFVGLSDTPSAYDYPTKYVRINATNDGLEFATITEGVDTFIDLTDTPAAYGYPTQYVRMNSAGDALEFATISALQATTIINDPIWDTSGDIVVGTGNDTATILSIGLTDQIIKVNGAGTALEYATVSTLIATAKRTIFLSMAGGWTSTTLPDGGFFATETSTNKINFKGTKFAASADDQNHEFGCMMPANYDGGTITAKFCFYVPTSTDASDHTIILGLQGVAFSDGDAGDTAYGDAQTATETVSSSIAGKVIITSATSAITIANTPSGEKWTQFRVYREGDDTYSGDIIMLGVLISYGIDNYSDV